MMGSGVRVPVSASLEGSGFGCVSRLRRLRPKDTTMGTQDDPRRHQHVIAARSPFADGQLDVVGPSGARTTSQKARRFCLTGVNSGLSDLEGRSLFGYFWRTALASLGFVALAAAISVAAASACNPGRSTNSTYTYKVEMNTGPTWDGGHCLTGVGSPIEVKNPFVQSGKSSGWTSLENPLTSEIGQVGWMNVTPNYTRENFAEFAQGNTIHQFRTWTADAVGSYPLYSVTFGGGSFHIFENATHRYDFSDSTYQGCWAAAATEIQNTNSQMPGVQADHETIEGNEVTYNGSGGWVFFNTAWAHGFSSENNQTIADSPDDECGPAGCNDPNSGGLLLTKGDHFDWNMYQTDPQLLDIWDMCS
jgi:hypothetical protein